MTTSIEDIAARLQAAAVESPEAYTATLATLWADEVNVTHEPARQWDHPRPRADQVGLHEREDAAFRQAMPDFRQEDVAVTIDGDVITLAATIRGTRRDGAAISVPVRWRFTVKDGTIPAVVTVVEPDDSAPTEGILRAGGVEIG
jgi:hypothetical protein